ncbi:DUF4342 domain-containing protein [Clostridium sp. MB40-C1]|uniref:DUF4342 domain-containing protein n=1 Tax=Clostridium sp. MB40-C1 TaxID=3070996 RepID=UPI0027DFF30E|nr:DUF4342 domain-containing protein [Clostridium sp. MB40-C1]WMJ82302.1 DUF4342 domain-containing protein [Clostridium sp. MB40-C1]
MNDISLEKIDIVRERTGVSYTEAKEALEACNGDVVEALIYIEKNQKNKYNLKDDIYTTKEEFMAWLKETIKKGNVNRIIIKKDTKVIADIPVNAGVAAGVIALAIPSLAILGMLTAVITKISVEIIKSDGSVEVVNKIIKDKAQDVKEKFDDFTSEVKEKFDNKGEKTANKDDSDNVYQYTVTFEDIDEDKEKNNDGR